jgi:thiamine pyrophosphokinase
MTCAILLNGDYEDDAYYLRLVDAAQAVVAADGGHAFLRRHGRWPALLIGDFDSLDAGLLAEAEAAGVEIVRHPARKDETDAELAVAQAEARFPGEIVLLGALGGALDHVLGHLAILQGLAARGRAARIAAPGLVATVVRAPARLRFRAPVGTEVSLVALSPDVVLSLRGLEYELSGERLSPTVCRGLGNSLAATDARLELSSGALLVLVFDGRETFAAPDAAG